jgi:hypothetical protein
MPNTNSPCSPFPKDTSTFTYSLDRSTHSRFFIHTPARPTTTNHAPPTSTQIAMRMTVEIFAQERTARKVCSSTWVEPRAYAPQLKYPALVHTTHSCGCQHAVPSIPNRTCSPRVFLPIHATFNPPTPLCPKRPCRLHWRSLWA